MLPPEPAASAQLVVSGQPFDETVTFFGDLGFRVDSITPADDPELAVMSGFGLSLRIDRSVTSSPITLRIETDRGATHAGPNGLRVDFVASAGAIELPELVPELVVAQAASPGDWVTGRAGMRYRDLIPSRLGGRFIASHIEVCDGGPVPDLVHHHAIRFQMIFCHRGWVDVVYQDQGPPFRLNEGDGVLQPPHIRHKVLASSAGAQVVEIGSPARHDTLFDYEVELPNDTVNADRQFGGQQFVHHIAASVPWHRWGQGGMEAQTTAIADATRGLASARVLRATKPGAGSGDQSHQGEFLFVFVLDGSVRVEAGHERLAFRSGDSIVIPAGLRWSLSDASSDLRALEVSLPQPAAT